VVNVKEILASSKDFDQEMFRKLLVRTDLPHLLLSDVTNLLNGITRDFP